MPGEENTMLIFKGVLAVFALFAIALAAFMILGRGGQFDTRFFTKGGAFLLGIGLGTSLVGFGLLMVGKLAQATLQSLRDKLTD
jgi:hypothetical protein